MIRNSMEKEFPKKEIVDYAKKLKGASSSRPWSSAKDPRIVRVARSFGGKDRHSKVCTIRGLRDRRVRLSVQTAIQLYDLQDRLGLSQPSKVVDWLLDAAQEDIDKLPPLQMPIENLFQYAQVPFAISHEVNQNQIPSCSTLNYTKLSDGQSLTLMPSNELKTDEMRNGMRKDINCEKSWLKKIEEENQENSTLRSSQSSYPGLMNSFMPYTSHYHWEAPVNPNVPHFGGNGISSHMEDPYSLNPVAVPSSLSIPSGSQLLVYPSGAIPSIYSSFVPDYDLKSMTHLQMSQPLVPNSVTTSFYPVTSSMRTFQVNKTSKHHSSGNNDETRSAGEGASQL